jgi:uncharacterized protein YfdQ (DUF2303 family)
MTEATTVVSSSELLDKMRALGNVESVQAMRGNSLQALVFAVPTGRKLESAKAYLDQYLPAPERKTGTARLDELDDFIAHVNRTKDPQTVIFANKTRTSPSLLAVYDYNDAFDVGGAARWGQHRARHPFPVSDEWKSWVALDKKPMSQVDFAEFLEDRILDVAEPPLASPRTLEILGKMGDVALANPRKLLELSRGLTVHVASKLQNQVRLSSGEVSLIWQTEHQDEAGSKLSVPEAFLILVPLFQGGQLYPIIVRLKYKAGRGEVTWSYSLYRVEEMFELAIQTALERVKAETGLLVLAGIPEKMGREDE